MVKNDISWLAELEGKTIETAQSVGHESMLNYFIEIKFTDGTKKCFLNCRDYQIHIDEDVRQLFIRLWNKAGTQDYVKSEWMELASMLEERGIRV